MWEWRPEVLVPLGLVAVASGVGWWRLSKRGRRAVPLWRPALLAAGLTAVAGALLSPIAGTAHARFSTHMIQHVLLAMLAPPLLMVADPLPAALWALPRSVRLAAGRLLARRPGRRRRHHVGNQRHRRPHHVDGAHVSPLGAGRPAPADRGAAGPAAGDAPLAGDADLVPPIRPRLTEDRGGRPAMKNRVLS